ncbi:hypothetical protein [Mycolicibacterium septicum]|uniref:hypothetical protein n=1 Tax=Mycolicibacterium septicum TaxID=98668 RepID=UPI0023609955|nr:hypothetical protein [Mycolicibacterium septicum]
MRVRQDESFVEELKVELKFKEPITSSGSIMTLPAATADLKDWMNDRRKFLTVQYDDWMQVIGDFRDSLFMTGPKLRACTTSSATQVNSPLQGLFSASQNADGTVSHQIDAAVRADVLLHLGQRPQCGDAGAAQLGGLAELEHVGHRLLLSCWAATARRRAAYPAPPSITVPTPMISAGIRGDVV